MKKSALKTMVGLTAAAGLTSAVSAWAVDLAKVNGRTISDSDLKMALGSMNQGQRDAVLKDPNSRRQILLSLIDQEVLLQEGEKEKIDQSAEYKAALVQFRKQYLANKVLEKNLASRLTDKTARSYYDKNKSKFSTDQVHVEHILAESQEKAEELLKKANAPNADFNALAEQFSRDPSAKNNRGDLGFINRDSPYVKEFKDVAFETAEGKVAGPVKTAYGYHLIHVVKKKFGKPLSYDEVELRVKEELRQDLVESYVGKLKQQAKVQVDDKALDKLN
jgi:peptidyl-prolyl cis-trans isomerase C